MVISDMKVMVVVVQVLTLLGRFTAATSLTVSIRQRTAPSATYLLARSFWLSAPGTARAISLR